MAEKLMKLSRSSNYRQKMVKLIGHDLKQPLSVIKIAAYYLKKTCNGKQLEHLEKIDNQVNLLSEALSQLAEAERVFDGEVALQIEYFSLTDELHAVIEDFNTSRSGQIKPLSLTKNYVVMGDKERSSQAVMSVLHSLASLKHRVKQIDIEVHQQAKLTICTLICEVSEKSDQLCKNFCVPFALAEFQDHGQGYFHGGNFGLGPFIAQAIFEHQKGKITVQYMTKKNSPTKTYLEVVLDFRSS